MKLKDDFCHQHGASVVDAAQSLRLFVQLQRDGLIAASELLAGTDGRRLTERLVERIAAEVDLSRTTKDLLVAVLDLLTLQNVHDPDRPEYDYFSAIHPCDPVVEDCCLLADGLRDALSACERSRKARRQMLDHHAAA